MRKAAVGERPPDLIRSDVWESTQVGMWAWLTQRVTAVLLIVLVPLKIFTGYVMVGDIAGNKSWAADYHVSAVIDAVLLFACTFHALYGLRVIMIDYGWVKPAKAVFKVFTAVAVVIYIAALYFVVFS